MGSYGGGETKTTLNVRGMSCGHCKMAVEKALKFSTGVTEAIVDLNKNTVTVVYDENKTNVEQIKDVIIKAGYEPM